LIENHSRDLTDCNDYSSAFAKFDLRSRMILPRKRSFDCTRTLYIHREMHVDCKRIENELLEEMNRYFSPTSAEIKFCGLFIAVARCGGLFVISLFGFIRMTCDNLSSLHPTYFRLALGNRYVQYRKESLFT